MQPASKYYYWKENSLYMALYVQPRAHQNKIVGTHGDRLKIQIATLPIKGKANDELNKFLAKYFSISQKQIKLISGPHDRNKLVQFQNPPKTMERLFPRD